jgi:hypothetical protein
MQNHEIFVSLTKKELKLFIYFENLRAQAIKTIHSQTDDLESDIDFVFGKLTNQYSVCDNTEILNVIYTDDEGVGFTSPYWVNCFGEKIVCYIRPYIYNDGYGNGIQIKKYRRIKGGKFDLIPFFKGSAGGIREESTPVQMVSDAMGQFFQELPELCSKLENRITKLKIDRGLKEFGLSLEKDNYFQTKKPKKKDDEE